MAKSLNLKAVWLDDDTLRISWIDVIANDTNKAAAIIIPIVAFVVFIYSSFLAISGRGFTLMGLTLVSLFVFVIWFRNGTTSTPNHVDFTAKQIKHNGRTFQTNEVTRFDYGITSSLTGITPARDGNGNSMSDPFLVRMWVNDAYPHKVSSNNWEMQVNHQIRDALSQALDAVRDRSKKQKTEEEFGAVGDDGMPDY